MGRQARSLPGAARRVVGALFGLLLCCAIAVEAATPMVAAGNAHAVGVRADGTVWVWGSNALPLGTLTYHTSNPVQIRELTGIQTVAAGLDFTVALKSDGTVWSWGRNDVGQVGNGTTLPVGTPVQPPVQVVGLTNVIAVAAGAFHVVALKADGTVWTWGKNDFGQLGNGSMLGSSTPVLVSGLAGVQDVAAGESHTVARKSDGTVWTWGKNNLGQLGNGSTNASLTPVQVAGPGGVGSLNGVDKVSAGEAQTFALKSDGTLWAWGYGGDGRLGNGSTDLQKTTPVQVVGPDGIGFLTDVSAVRAGHGHTVAVKTDGTLYAWGNNSLGELGIGNIIQQLRPVNVNGLSGVQTAAAGLDFTVAFKADGTVWTWGKNDKGQLGNGIRSTDPATPSPAPVQVIGRFNFGPQVPLGVTALPGDSSATVSFTKPSTNSGAPIVSYLVTSTPGGTQASGTGSPIVVTGLLNGTPYTFTVSAVDSVGTTFVSTSSNTVTPTAAATKKSLYGLGFGPYLDNQNPEDIRKAGGTISETQIRDRLNIIKQYTNRILTYDVTIGLAAIPDIAREFGIDTYVGATVYGGNPNNLDCSDSAGEYVGPGTSRTEQGLQNLVHIGQQGKAQVLIVGNEALRLSENPDDWKKYPDTRIRRDCLSESLLLSYIQRVKQQVPGVPVTYMDFYDQLLHYPNIVNAVDVVMVNIYPFWSGVSVEQARAMIDDRYAKVAAVAQGKPVLISETGWPSDGTPPVDGPAAVPSPPNQRTFVADFLGWAQDNNVPYFLFEAFDEKWKAASGEGELAAHWGLYKSDGTLKDGMSAILAIPPNAPTAVVATANLRSITVSFMPPSDSGGAPISHYSVSSIPAGVTATGSGSPIEVTGLAVSTPYSFTVTATNAAGSGISSAPSNTVTIVPDSIPEALSFTPRSNVLTAQLTTSSPVVVTGINVPASITIIGGTYSINGAPFTAAAGTANYGDTIAVQVTASNNIKTSTCATTTVGGVAGQFCATTGPLTAGQVMRILPILLGD